MDSSLTRMCNTQPASYTMGPNFSSNALTELRVFGKAELLQLNGIGTWEGEGSKIGQNCQWIVVLKNCRHGGGGIKNPEKWPTSFMDGP